MCKILQVLKEKIEACIDDDERVILMDDHTRRVVSLYVDKLKCTSDSFPSLQCVQSTMEKYLLLSDSCSDRDLN